MDGVFEDARSLDNSYTQKHSFYTLMNGTAMNDPYPIPPHWHYYVEVLYITEGMGNIILNGQTFQVIKGDLVMAMPRDVHSISLVSGQPFNYILLKFDPDMLFDSAERSFLLKNIAPILEPITPRLKVIHTTDYPADICEDLKIILNLFENKPYGFELMTKSKILKVFYDYALYLYHHDVKLLSDTQHTKEISILLPAYEYIHVHYREPISAKDVADYCHLSYSYFSRVFKKLSGISFTKYLNFMRITEAEKLLLHNNSSVTEVGFNVGFADTSYFIKQFKSFKNLTPKEYIDFVRR